MLTDAALWRELLPAWDTQRVLVEPWSPAFREGSFWIVWMGFLVTACCGLVGNYLILRRMALVGDAISHSVLPGLAIAYLASRSLEIGAMVAGAVVAGLATTLLIEFIHTRSRVKSDAAIGIAFCSLFALGVLLINRFAAQIHLDTECVLAGEIAYMGIPGIDHLIWWGLDLGPRPVGVMLVVTIAVVLGIAVFYKELLLTAFDPGLAAAAGFAPRATHYAMMAVLSVVVVAAFEAVGAILVIAMLIVPGATAQLLSRSLPRILGLTLLHAALTAVGGFHLGMWLSCSLGGAMVVVAGFLFVLAWIGAPGSGLVALARIRLEGWRAGRSGLTSPRSDLEMNVPPP